MCFLILERSGSLDSFHFFGRKKAEKNFVVFAFIREFEKCSFYETLKDIRKNFLDYDCDYKKKHDLICSRMCAIFFWFFVSKKGDEVRS